MKAERSTDSPVPVTREGKRNVHGRRIDSTVRSEDRTARMKPTACILCECNCGLEVQLGGEGDEAGRRLTKIRGDKAHPASEGYACEKPSRLDYYQNDSERLTRPLRRRPDGGFDEIDWRLRSARSQIV